MNYLHTDDSWDTFNKKTIEQKVDFFRRGSRIYNLIFAEQIEKKDIDRIYDLTNKIRLIYKTNEGARWLGTLLSRKKVMLYFIQPSTRTFLSFSTACQNLGMYSVDVRSTQTSSETKGESQEDTIRTFSSYFDLVIIRHFDNTFIENASFVLTQTRRPIPIINAGSGQNQHPTQSLIDIFTLRKSFEKIGGIQGKTIMIVGDLLRSRTVRSLCVLLKNFPGAKIVFCAPEGFSVAQDVKEILESAKYDFVETENFLEYATKADAIYMTRVQSEYDTETMDTKKLEFTQFNLTKDVMSLLKPNCFIMHPLPRKGEIHPDVDKDPRAIYWRQVRNGMWVRTALLSYIFKIDQLILDR